MSIGDFHTHSTCSDGRLTPTLLVDPYSQSANNLVRFIAEERIAVGSPRPTALVKVTFNGTA